MYRDDSEYRGTPFSGGYEHNTERCPYCGEVCEADWVDVGVGLVQCGPYHCEKCGAIEIGAFDNYTKHTEAEKKTGWYAPEKPYTGVGNMVGGKLVSHQKALRVYKENYPFSATEEGKRYIREIGEPT